MELLEMIRLKGLYAELLRWVRDQGYWPKRFRPGHKFLLPVTLEIKPYWILTPAQRQHALWVPCPEDVPFTVAWDSEPTVPDLIFLTLGDPITREPVASGFGESRIDALLSALQALRRATACHRESVGTALGQHRDGGEQSTFIIWKRDCTRECGDAAGIWTWGRWPVAGRAG
jgi:hypothetical protein